MPGDMSNLTLRAAVLQALRDQGIDVLKRPEVFLSIVKDYADLDLPTMRLMELNCNSELLDYYAEAAVRRTPEAMGDAAARATLLLEHDRLQQRDPSEQLACELAFALGTFLGVGCPESVRTIATRDAVTQSAPSTAEPEEPSSAWMDAQRARAQVREDSGKNDQDDPGASANKGADTGASMPSASSGAGAAKSGSSSSKDSNGPAGTGKSSTAQSRQQTGSSKASSSQKPSKGPGAAKGSSKQGNGSSGKPSATSSTSGSALVRGSQVAATIALMDPSTLSSDPKERIVELEAAGIGMKGYAFIKSICWPTACLRVYNLFSLVQASNEAHEAGLFRIYRGADSLIGLEALLMLVLAISYLVSWNKLKKFRRGGPAWFLWTLGVNIVLPPIMASSLAQLMGLTSDMLEPDTLSMLMLWFNVTVLISSWIYLSHRKELFNLDY